MAAEVEPAALISTKRLEGTLVAPRLSRPVPNHLANTRLAITSSGVLYLSEIFAKVNKNGLLKTQPAVIHFDGYQVGGVHQQTLRILNASRDNQQMNIIPPTTPFFTIKYSKQRSSLVPGLSLEVTVQFRPKEWKYYYDCIRIHCKGEQNLLVPIHAYPVMNTARFPKSANFPPTLISQSRTKNISLECDVPIDFEFQISYLQHHPAFTVNPMKGMVPANGKVDIAVTFTPTEFSTAIMKLQVELSQFNSSPLVCTFTGSSSPGLAVDQIRTRSSQPRLLSRPTRTHPLPPLERTRQKTHGGTKPKRVSSTGTLPSRVEEEVIYEGIRFPPNLETPSAVGKVLAQQPGKVKASELRQVSSQTGHGLSSRQMKEATFLQEVRQAAAEERANQLRWVTNIGSLAMTMVEKEAVFAARRDANWAYQRRHCHVPVPEDEFSRSTTECVYRRTRRRAREHPQHTPKFDPYCNDMWMRRHLVLQRFVQAGRRVILRLSCQKKLERLQRLRGDLTAGKSLAQSLMDLSSEKEKDIPSVVSKLPTSSHHILPFSFPKYLDTSRVDETAPGAHGRVDVKPTVVEVKKGVPFIDLKVPQQYRLLGYSPQSVPPSGSYIPPGLVRPLRTGAEDELENLGHIPGVDPLFLTPSALLTEEEPVDRNIPESTEPDIKLQDLEGGEWLPLVPPLALFKLPHRHPMEVFNPAPGVNQYVPLLPHSELTFDYALMPLPPYPTAKHPQVRLEQQDVIPGVMKWKQFPSHCLVTLEGDKKLSSVWKPRWSDPLSEELLPHLQPQLLSGPQPDDCYDNNNSELLPTPTPEMVRAQFYIPDSTIGQQDGRLAAEEQLDADKSHHFSQLGQRIDQILQIWLTHRHSSSRMKTITEET